MRGARWSLTAAVLAATVAASAGRMASAEEAALETAGAEVGTAAVEPPDDATVESGDAPLAEPVAEPAAEPVAEPVAEPAAEPVAEPVAEPAAEPVAEPAAEPEPEAARELPTVLRFGLVELSPDLKVYADWMIDVGGGDGANAFHVTRAYLGLRARITEWVSGRVTFDVAQATDVGASGSAPVEEGEAAVDESRLVGSELGRLKYAYIDLGIPPLSLHLQFGIVPTPWIGWMEHIEDSRFLRKIMLENEYGYPSADFGLALTGNVGDWLAYHVGIYNGEGYHGLESGQFKDVIGRLSFRPAPAHRWLSGLQLSGYVQAELPPPSPDTEGTARRYGGAVSYRLGERVAAPDVTRVECERLAAWFQAFYGEDGPADALTGSWGFSLGARVELPARFFVLGRLDRFVPDLDQADEAIYTVLAVAGFRPAPHVIIALDYQGRLQASGESHMLGVHTELSL